MLTVHVRIADAGSKRAVPVRLRINDASGRYYPPLGRAAAFPCGVGEAVGGSVRIGGDNWAVTDGTCEVPLPAGVPLRVQALHGPEWEPVDRTITLGPGQMAVRLEMTRWFDRQADGWRSSDSRAHFLSPHAALLEAAAEDLDDVHLLAHVHSILASDGNVYATTPNLTSFSGQVPAVEADGRRVFVNTFNTHPMLGKLGLHHCHRVVYPLAFGGEDGPDDWSLTSWCDQCHRKTGRTVWCEPFREGLPGGEALIAAVLGKVDAVEYDPHPRRQPFLPWLYRLWSAGIEVALVGGSAKTSNRTPLGAMRTYEPTSGGIAFVTNGPMLKFRKDGTKLVASAESIVPFEKIEIVIDGLVAASSVANTSTRFTASVEVEFDPAGCRWAAVRCIGGAAILPFSDHPAFAHTAAVVVGTRGPDAKAVEALRTCVRQTREWIDTLARFSGGKFRTQHQERCDEADARLLAKVP